MAHAADAKHCRRCGAPYVFDAIYLGHLGHYHCPSCGQRRPTPAVTATGVDLEGVRAARLHPAHPAGEAGWRCRCPGSTTSTTPSPPLRWRPRWRCRWRASSAGCRRTRPRSGAPRRVTLSPGAARPTGSERVGRAARELQILLVKNPAGANEVLRTLALEPGEHDLLGVLNDKIADGRDVSWIWDADFELLAGRIRRVTCSGTRAPELALRLKYAGIDPRSHPRPARPAAGARAAPPRPARTPDAPLYALPTYTAMLALRELLVARGEASSAWS